MSHKPLISTVSAAETRLIDLSRWDNEGGAGPVRAPAMDAQHPETPPLTNAELIQLRARVTALENMMITLLAQASVTSLAHSATVVNRHRHSGSG